MKFLHCFCVVDSSLRILWVGGDWDDFAMANGGGAILANDVLSTRLTDHITDDPTTEAVAKLVRAVIATKGTLRMDYRCDAPHELRRMRLTIKPMKDDRAIMVHELRDAVQLRPEMGLWSFDPAARNLKCSICGKVHLPDGPWFDPAQRGNRHPEFVSYTVCPTCVGHIETAITGIIEGALDVGVGDLNLKPGLRND
ncbi:hypothetical protein [Pseudorhodobacter sp. MZDSW-24AT]|uniref:hypothetical protein n=1 Tax=Pseudorhodobacter sp. MZDSW-24AT TaxID=2052957 RepID=UPI000C1F3AF8|nr:hypothetical protein [Pseudorhodobacter sp. MZDSW-24AT]PJF08126.1 hypothetical protein CUR21_15775 [Pseudorhodobacter sp. MZDSW-24AT]